MNITILVMIVVGILVCSVLSYVVGGFSSFIRFLYNSMQHKTINFYRNRKLERLKVVNIDSLESIKLFKRVCDDNDIDIIGLLKGIEENEKEKE